MAKMLRRVTGVNGLFPFEFIFEASKDFMKDMHLVLHELNRECYISPIDEFDPAYCIKNPKHHLGDIVWELSDTEGLTITNLRGYSTERGKETANAVFPKEGNEDRINIRRGEWHMHSYTDGCSRKYRGDNIDWMETESEKSEYDDVIENLDDVVKVTED